MQEPIFNSTIVKDQLKIIAQTGWRIHETQTEIKWRAGLEYADIFTYTIQPSGRIHRTQGGSLKKRTSCHERLIFLRDDQLIERAALKLRDEFRKIAPFSHEKCSLQILVSEEKRPATKVRLRVDEIWFAQEYLTPDSIQRKIEDYCKDHTIYFCT